MYYIFLRVAHVFFIKGLNREVYMWGGNVCQGLMAGTADGLVREQSLKECKTKRSGLGLTWKVSQLAIPCSDMLKTMGLSQVGLSSLPLFHLVCLLTSYIRWSSPSWWGEKSSVGPRYPHRFFCLGQQFKFWPKLGVNWGFWGKLLITFSYTVSTGWGSW